MNNPTKAIIIALALTFTQANAANTDTTMGAVKSIQQEWARLNYMEEFKNVNYKELQNLARKASQVSFGNPDSAEALVWDAIVLSTLAGKKGGIGALSLVREAKLKLEKAEVIDANVLGGSVYTSLATLYAKVPGWPLGFGSTSTAEKYFQKALAVNPNSLDANYFYAEFLAENDQDDMAISYIDKALSAPVLQGRPVADKGRREQAKQLRDSLTAI